MNVLVSASGMGGLGDGLMLMFIGTVVMPGTALLGSILAWRALRLGGLEWPLVRAAAVVLAVPYGMALLVGHDLSGPVLLFDEAWGLLNPMAAIAIAVAVALRHAALSESGGSDRP